MEESADALGMDRWELWDTERIAERTGYQRRYVQNRIITKPDFPVPIRATGDDAKPRWVAAEVIAWFEGRRAA